MATALLPVLSSPAWAQTSFTNGGTITSNSLSVGSAALDNTSTGTLNITNSITVNSGAGTLNNAGTLSPAGFAAIATTTLNGNYVQASTGKLFVTADWTGNGGTGASDKLAVNGTAVLAGTILVRMANHPATVGLTRTFYVLTATGGITDNGISATAFNTSTVRYSIVKPDLNTLNLLATIDYTGTGGSAGVGGPGATGGTATGSTATGSTATGSTATGGTATGGTATGGASSSPLTFNQYAIGTSLNSIQASSAGLPFMSYLQQLPVGGSLGGALAQLTPHNVGQAARSTISTSQTFGNQLLSCREIGEEADVTRFIREGQCVWARIGARRLDGQASSDGGAFKERATLLSAGVQLDGGGPWKLGGGFAYETGDAKSSNTSAQTERMHLGGVVKYSSGPLLLAASGTGGWGWSENVRTASFGGFNGVATSSPESLFATGRLTAAYLFGFGGWYLKPQVELAANHIRRDAYTESATGGIGLSMVASRDTVLSAAPSLEVGAELMNSGGKVVRGFVRAGAIVLDDNRFISAGSFTDAPGSTPIVLTTRVDRVLADLGAGLDLMMAGSGLWLRLQYDGQIGETTTQHAGSGKVSLKF